MRFVVCFGGMDYEINRSLSQVMKETFSSLVGGRLKEARKALGLNQAQAAELAGVSREHWGRLERGAAVPGGEVLAALAVRQVDVNYLLTGMGGVLVASAPLAAALRPDQEALLDNYEHADNVGRQAAQRLLDPQSQRKKA